MEKLMTLQRSIKQVVPRRLVSSISKLDKVHTILEADEITVSVDELLPESASHRTQLFEAAVVFVAMGGNKLNLAKINSIMSNSEFSVIAKSWTSSILKDKRNEGALVDWYSNIGYPITKLGKFKDFIHENINEYYKISPSSFKYAGAEKANTADIILIVNSNKTTLFNTLKEIKALPEKEQVLRATTESDGKITISDSKGKEVSFYQISAKKGAGEGRIGKVGAFINRNIIKGTPHLPSNLLDILQREDYSHLSEREIELFTEGFFGDLVNKFKNVATLGIKVFLNWTQKLYGSVAKNISNISEKVTNRILSKDRGVIAANNILKEVGLSSLVEAKIGSNIQITPKMKKELTALQTLLKKINTVHNNNVSLVSKLNSRPKMKSRPRPPIYFPNPQDGLIDISSISKEIENISKQTSVSRDTFKLVVSIVANFAANIAINAMLKSIESSVDKYEDLTESLFAFSSTLDAEARFGNTSLPLVICYGGKGGNNMVLGKRDDYTKVNTKELVEKGKMLNNFYIAVIEIYKSAGVNPYNISKFHLVTGFEERDKKPFPKFTMISISNSSGSKFYTKIEAEKSSPKKSVDMWT